MLAFSGTAPPAAPAGQRAVYVGTLAAAVATSPTLAAELEGTGVHVHVVCPGIVATEFHEVQGMDLSALPRMSPDDVVAAALAGMGLGETVIAPGVEDASLLDAASAANLAAFTGQSATLASRYRRQTSSPFATSEPLPLPLAAPAVALAATAGAWKPVIWRGARW
jgi:short-subunit dehydrogenase